MRQVNQDSLVKIIEYNDRMDKKYSINSEGNLFYRTNGSNTLGEALAISYVLFAVMCVTLIMIPVNWAIIGAKKWKIRRLEQIDQEYRGEMDE
jgi:hypothetical protein